MAITMKDFKPVFEEIDKKNEQATEEFFNLMPAIPDRELVKQTCETFTRLLLSITPYSAKEYVERNCERVRRRIMQEVNERAMQKFRGGESYDE